MAGFAAAIEIADDGLGAYFARLIAAGLDLAPALEEIGEDWKTRTEQGFDLSRAPDGKPWKPSIRVRQEGGRTLVARGRLRDSVVHQVQGDAVLLGTVHPHARIHQFGGTIRPKNKKALHFEIAGRKVTVAKVTMPPRPFVGAGPAHIAAWSKILAEHLQGEGE